MTRLALASAAVAAILAAAYPAQAEKIGVASVITNQVQGSGPPRSLAVGGDVFSSEHIRTGDSSAAQLLFLDSTSVSVGAHSDLTLDKFVYDPAKGTGNVVVTTSKGAFRFITGSQNPTHYSIRTPVATIGVRGTIVGVYTYTVGGVTTTVVTLYEGHVIISNIPGYSGPPLNLIKVGTSYIIKSDGTIQGPLQGNGNVASFLNNPQLFDLPDNRFDLLGSVGAHGPTQPQGSGGSSCTFTFSC